MLAEINKLILKCIWKRKGTEIAKNNFEKQQSWRTHTASFQDLLESFTNQDHMVSVRGRMWTDRLGQSPGIDPDICELIFNKGARAI